MEEAIKGIGNSYVLHQNYQTPPLKIQQKKYFETIKYDIENKAVTQSTSKGTHSLKYVQEQN